MAAHDPKYLQFRRFPLSIVNIKLTADCLHKSVIRESFLVILCNKDSIMATADDQLIKNLEVQLQRLVEELKDLEECSNEISKEEFDMIKQENAEQIKEFSETLDRMQRGNVTLNNTVTVMKNSIRKAIAKSFNTAEMIKMFGAQDINEREQQLVSLEEEFRLKKISKEEYVSKKVELLTVLQSKGHTISSVDIDFLQKAQDNILECMELLVEDN